MKQTIEINSLQDFVTELSNLDSNYYFRGESSIHYNKILASAFRLYPTLFSDGKKQQFNYQKALKEYYTEIAHELSELERDNFLHYAQHHGLPTPLIDITSNPLTALYFSCSSNFGENKCRVYAFNQNRFIDFSEFEKKEDITLNNFFFDNDFTYQVLIKIHGLSEPVKKELLFDCVQNLKPLIKKKGVFTDSKYIGKDTTPTLVEILKRQFSVEYNNLEDFCKTFVAHFSSFFELDFKYNNGQKKFRTSISFLGQEAIFEVHYKQYLSDELAVIILFLINQQSTNMIDDFQLRGIMSDEFLSDSDSYGVVFPPIVVHPSVKFERMKSQEGTFLYQVPHFKGNTTDYIGFSKVDGDIEFIINDKKDIFITLSKLGVNRKTIFPDHDNIAEFLKNKQLLE